MKSKKDKKQQAFEKDYNEIMRGFQNQRTTFNNNPQWTKPTDFIVKFSLYQESPNSITSTDTTVNL